MENADKQIAWFPASYLEQISAHKDIQNVESSDEGEYGSVPRQQLWFPDQPCSSFIKWALKSP